MLFKVKQRFTNKIYWVYNVRKLGDSFVFLIYDDKKWRELSSDFCEPYES